MANRYVFGKYGWTIKRLYVRISNSGTVDGYIYRGSNNDATVYINTNDDCKLTAPNSFWGWRLTSNSVNLAYGGGGNIISGSGTMTKNQTTSSGNSITIPAGYYFSVDTAAGYSADFWAMTSVTLTRSTIGNGYNSYETRVPFKISGTAYWNYFEAIPNDTLYSTFSASSEDAYSTGPDGTVQIAAGTTVDNLTFTSGSDVKYIKLIGTDVIDPISVSYDTPHGGELLDIIVTPSASIQYGGTISYKYETSTDGGVTWTTVNASTTATTVSVLVPAGVQTFQARVTASDNMGFTSTTAVAGENIAVINNVAPVITCMVLDLGKLAAAFSVDYNVSDEDGDQMTVTEAVDGVKIRDFSIPYGGGGTH